MRRWRSGACSDTSRPRSQRHHDSGTVWAFATLSVLSVAGGQTATLQPFGFGERLVFVVSTARSSKIGEAVMTLSGPTDVRGLPAVMASFDTDIQVATMKASNKSTSWFDARDMTSLRFVKHERRPLSSQDDSVEVFPDRHRWESAHDVYRPGGRRPPARRAIVHLFSAHDILRTRFHLLVRAALRCAAKSNDRARCEARDLQTRAGTFETTELEMRVKDGAEYKGDGVLHIWISDDACRLPVRIESAMPLLGVGILTLDSAVTPSCRSDEPQRPKSQFRDR